LIDAYIGSEGVLTGTARVLQEARDQAESDLRGQEIERKKREIARRRTGLERQIADLRASLELEEEEALKLLVEQEARESSRALQRNVVSARRGAAE
jgi:circadian clock protein KaiC